MSLQLILQSPLGAGVDTAPPVITAISPTPNTAPGAAGGMSASYAAAKTTPIIVQITDLDGAADLIYISVYALFLDGSVESVYRNTSFLDKYVAHSSQGSITNGKQLSIARTGDWPGAGTLSNLAVGLIIDAVDAGGNVSTVTSYWQLPAAGSSTSTGLPVTPAPTTGAIDHLAAALARLPEQFKIKAVF